MGVIHSLFEDLVYYLSHVDLVKSKLLFKIVLNYLSSFVCEFAHFLEYILSKITQLITLILYQI